MRTAKDALADIIAINIEDFLIRFMAGELGAVDPLRVTTALKLQNKYLPDAVSQPVFDAADDVPVPVIARTSIEDNLVKLSERKAKP
jgi:hypothetical protein